MRAILGDEGGEAAALAFAFFSAADGLRAACAGRRWRAASERPEAWRGVRLTARRPSESIFGEADAPEDEELDSLMAMPDALFRSLVCKLRRVGERHDLDVVPPANEEGAPRRVETPLHIRRFRFGGRAFWFLCYNTKVFGWFDKEHTNTFPCGFKVWAPTPLMCRWFSNPSTCQGGVVEGQSVLELGSGMGILGATLSARARQVVITDVDPSVLRAVAANVCANDAINVKVERLAYGRANAATFRESQGVFDHIVGADIIYGSSVIRPIFESVDELLAADGTFSLGFVDRNEQFAVDIMSTSEALGFEQARPPFFLAEALGDVAPKAEEERRTGLANTGMLAELREVLRRIPQGGSCYGEAAEKAQLLQFRRRAAAAAVVVAPAVPFDLNAMD